MADPRAWNPWHGCRRYSEGCRNCYMFFLDKVRGVPEKASDIVRTRDFLKPLQKDAQGRYRIPSGFVLRVNMTSDTFLEEADAWRDEMWDVIRKRPDVVFYILTKRVPRIEQCLPEDWGDGYENVILNISVENQAVFDERWHMFEKIPAKHKGLNVSPLLGEVDITPALASGQIEHVDVGGEGYGGETPCRHEWLARISAACEEYRVNLSVDSVGNVYVKDGVVYRAESIAMAAKWAYHTGLSRFYGRPRYRLFSPRDGHPLSEDELIRPVFNRDRCTECTQRPICMGCTECGNCRDVILVDYDGNPAEKTKGPFKAKTVTLDDFVRSDAGVQRSLVRKRNGHP